MTTLSLPTDNLQTADANLLPSLVAKADENAQYKFVEFFTATISNANTRQAYARAVYRFMAWCESQNLALEQIHPVATASYIRQLEQAQDIAGHADPRTTRLYDRRYDRIGRAEIERVQY